MNILFTGASSFTGAWFARELARAGHEVVATFTAGHADAYSGIRRERIESLPPSIARRFGCSFGDEAMLALIGERRWDLLCHHGAMVGAGYKSGAFDFMAALAANTRNAGAVLDALQRVGCQRLLVTGSYFEADEGAGPDFEAVSAYGLSKTLAWQTFRRLCHERRMTLGKFVIANPFGPLEEARLSAHLAVSWLAGNEPTLQTPEYVRDFIPVDLLALRYREVVSAMAEQPPGWLRFSPSFWVESTLDFSRRMAAQLAPRFGKPCPVRALTQTDFREPLARRNTEPVDAARLGWSEESFWDQLADWYRR